MWFPESERRIYHDPRTGQAHDPLDLRQRLVIESDGLVWGMLQRRRACYVALQNPADLGAEAAAELELAQAERRLVPLARKVFAMPGDVGARSLDVQGVWTDDEVLDALDRFVGWLAEKKASTAASPSP